MVREIDLPVNNSDDLIDLTGNEGDDRQLTHPDQTRLARENDLTGTSHTNPISLNEEEE
jgi:hypothetical protein